MNWVGYVILGIIIAILLFIYVLLVLRYFRTAKDYREAKRVTAIIKEDLGDLKMAIGSITIGVPKYRVYHRYKVLFWLNGEEYLEEAELKADSLNIDDSVEIRYDFAKNGRLELKSEAFLCWSRERAVGYTIGIIFGIVLCFLKEKGMI